MILIFREGYAVYRGFLPLSLSKNYIYRIPFDLNEHTAVGKRVSYSLVKIRFIPR